MKVFPGINVTSNAPRPRFVARPGNRDRVKHRIKTEGERERERERRKGDGGEEGTSAFCNLQFLELARPARRGRDGA